MNAKALLFIRVVAGVVLVAMVALTSCGPTQQPAVPTEPAQASQPTAAKTAEAVAPTEPPQPTEPPASEPVTFVYLVNQLTETLDEHVRADNPTGYISELVYEPLVEFAPGTMDIMPKLATDWTISDDGRTYTLHLRAGVKFHDGTSFDAEDVKATFDRILTLGLGIASQVSWVTDVRVVDPLTVDIDLKGAYAPFIGDLANVQIYSAEVIKAHMAEGEQGTEWFADNAVGTGPYKMESYKRGEEFVAVKFDEYWGGWQGKHVDKYVLRNVPEAATQRLMIEGGEAQMGDGRFAVEDLDQMAVQDNLVVYEYPSIRQFFLKMNTFSPRMSDQKVRQAVSLCFDQTSFCNDILNGHCDVANSLMPRVLPAHDPTWPELKPDPAKATQMLDDAGWVDSDGDGVRDKDGVALNLSLMYLQPYEWERMGSELLQACLSDIGIQAELEGQPWSTMVERMSDPASRPDIVFVAVYPTSPSPDTIYWPMFHTGSGHWSNFDFSDPKVDAMLEEARGTVDTEARYQIYRELDRYLMEQAPAIPAVTMTTFFIASPKVQGMQLQPMDPYIPPFYEMYLEQ